ncbi:MAG: MATE family efflux transporter, partial [Rubricella sp.]
IRPMIAAVFSYWIVGFPAGWVLAFTAGFGARGIWMGLAIGLGTASVLLVWRFWRLTQPLSAAPPA